MGRLRPWSRLSLLTARLVSTEPLTVRVDACVQRPPNSFTAKATIARQSGGRGLLAAFGTAQPTVPAAPRVTATRDQDGIHLSWPVPDSGGSPITSYSISRSTSASGGFSEIATTQNPKYDDAAVLDGTAYFYRVRARNAVGTGPACQVRVGPNTTVAESPCTAPGLTIIEDAEGDPLDALAQHDIRRASVAEPYFTDGSQKVVFTLKMSDLSAPLSSNTFWPVYFTTPDGQGHYVEMQTNPAGPWMRLRPTGTAPRTRPPVTWRLAAATPQMARSP